MRFQFSDEFLDLPLEGVGRIDYSMRQELDISEVELFLVQKKNDEGVYKIHVSISLYHLYVLCITKKNKLLK